MPVSRVKLRKPTIVHKDLMADEVWGYADKEDFLVEIEPNQKSKEYLNTLIHEMLHCFLPDLEEQHIRKMADLLSAEIWRRKYRRISK